jgi:hypothetical protein
VKLEIKKYHGAVWNTEIRLKRADEARVYAVLKKYFRKVDVFEKVY